MSSRSSRRPRVAAAARAAVIALAAGVVLAAAGCSGSANAGSGAAAGPHRLADTAARTRSPAAPASCSTTTWSRPSSACASRWPASAVSGATFTCALQPDGAGEPDLSLAVTATEADQSVFRASVVPKGATVVPDLGKVGYQTGIPAGGGAGPGLEVGWLSGNQRLMVLRYRGTDGTAAADVNGLLPKLVELAKKIDMTTV